MRQIFVLAVHAVFAVLFFWNTFRFRGLDDIGLYVNLIAALLAVISGLIYFLLNKRKRNKTQDQG